MSSISKLSKEQQMVLAATIRKYAKEDNVASEVWTCYDMANSTREMTPKMTELLNQSKITPGLLVDLDAFRKASRYKSADSEQDSPGDTSGRPIRARKPKEATTPVDIVEPSDPVESPRLSKAGNFEYWRPGSRGHAAYSFLRDQKSFSEEAVRKLPGTDGFPPNVTEADLVAKISFYRGRSKNHTVDDVDAAYFLRKNEDGTLSLIPSKKIAHLIGAPK